MKNLFVVDPLNASSSHLYFNSSILYLARKKDKVTLIAEKEHSQELKKVIHGIKFYPFSSGKTILRIIKSINILLLKVFLKKEKILFLSFDNSITPVQLLLFYPFFFRCSFTFILHNNLTTLCTNKIKLNLHRLLVNLYKARIIVLTKEMRKIYDKEVSNSRPCILLPHPNYENLIKIHNNNSSKKDNKIDIVLLGRQAKLMVHWLKETDFSEYANIKITLVYSGEINLEKRALANVTIIKKRIPYNEYYSILKNADFCLFALDKTNKNRASGILMDCISVKCPVIIPNIGHFLEYKFYDIGFVYEYLTEIKSILKKIDNNNIRRDDFQDRFNEALKYSSVHELSKYL